MTTTPDDLVKLARECGAIQLVLENAIAFTPDQLAAFASRIASQKDAQPSVKESLTAQAAPVQHALTDDLIADALRATMPKTKCTAGYRAFARRIAALASQASEPEWRDIEAFVRDLLWNDHPECCGSPVVGAEYMGQQEMVCCGCPEPAALNDRQIVMSLRERFPPSPPHSDAIKETKNG